MSFIVLASCFVAERASADGVVQSDFVFQMNNSIFNSPQADLGSMLTRSEHFDIPDMVVNAEVPVSLRGVSGDLSYSLSASATRVFMGSQIMFMSQNVSARLSIQELAIDAIIEERIGETVVRAHVKGSCKNVPLFLPPGLAKLYGAIRFGVDARGIPALWSPWFDAQWGTEAWVVGDFSCSINDRFRDRVMKGLKKYLAEPAGLSASLKSVIDARLAEYQDKIRQSFFTPIDVPVGVSGLRVSLSPKGITNIAGNSFQVFGNLEFRFNSARVEEIRVASAQAAPRTAESFSLLLPESLPDEVNEMAYRTGIYYLRKPGQEIAAFKDLMNNGLQRSIVWPELNQYNTDANFLFDFFTTERPRLSPIKDGGDGSLRGQIAGSLQTQIWAPTENGAKVSHRRMILFQTPLSGNFQLSLLPNTSGVDLRVLFSSVSMSLGGTWDAEYRASNESVSYSQIQSSIVQSLETDGARLNLKPVELNGVKLTPRSLGKRGPWLAIFWD